ncbi:MAG: glycosyl hydrolase, partial [bacterium]|nr:glycosyl hydrolase [Candidatus Kapabacteria bacterium]
MRYVLPLVGLLLLCSIESSAQPGWVIQNPFGTPTINGLHAVHFFDASVGMAVGDVGTILRTTDAGSTWVSQSSGTTSGLYGVSFLDASIGTIVGTSGTILRTTDAGATWVSQTSGTTDFLSGVSLGNANTGVAVGFKEDFSSGTLLRTTDGGSTWERQSTVQLLNDVAFSDPLTATVVGNRGTILRTTDGGAEWFAQTSGASDALNDVSFTDNNHG